MAVIEYCEACKKDSLIHGLRFKINSKRVAECWNCMARYYIVGRGTKSHLGERVKDNK